MPALDTDSAVLVEREMLVVMAVLVLVVGRVKRERMFAANTSMCAPSTSIATPSPSACNTIRSAVKRSSSSTPKRARDTMISAWTLVLLLVILVVLLETEALLLCLLERAVVVVMVIRESRGRYSLLLGIEGVRKEWQ